jgi:hypothetical protein
MLARGSRHKEQYGIMGVATYYDSIDITAI